MLISVCLPTYNGFDSLSHAVSSVLSQSHSELELLIGDDASTDGTFEIAQALAKTDDRIKCWRNDVRLGLFGNYNLCLERASGEFIKPFAQDDILITDALSEMAAVFNKESGVELVCVDGQLSDLYAGDVCAGESLRLQAGRTRGKRAILECLRSYRNLVGEPVAVMFRAWAKELKFKTTYRSLGDLEFWMRILERGDVWHIEKQLVSFKQHENSETMRLLENLDWVPDFFLLSKEYKSYFSELGIERDEYCMRFAELAGGLIQKMEHEGRLKISELDGFREVAYFAMKRSAQLGFKSREYDSVVNSTSWRLTKPLRAVMGRINRSV